MATLFPLSFSRTFSWLFPDLRKISLTSWYGILVETEIVRLNLRNSKTSTCLNSLTFPDFPHFLKFPDVSPISLISKTVANLTTSVCSIHFITRSVNVSWITHHINLSLLWFLPVIMFIVNYVVQDTSQYTEFPPCIMRVRCIGDKWSMHWRLFSALAGYHQCTGGYYQCNNWGYHDVCEGNHQYIGGCFTTMHCTHVIQGDFHSWQTLQ